MTKRTQKLLKHAAKASGHANELHLSLSKMQHLLPESDAWRELSQQARQIELQLENILALIEEMLQRDPEACAALLLPSDESPFDSPQAIGASAPVKDEWKSLYRLPRSVQPPYRT
jgi:hypothetical protein